MTPFFRTILSFFYPVRKKIETKYNGTLEVIWFFGQKRLDSKNTNYSYDSLLDVLDHGVSFVDLSKVETILLLGMGGGSIIHSLRNKSHYKNPIVAVELDPKVIEIAELEFAISPNEQLEIHEIDALEFVQSDPRKFDLIIVDLFIDTQVPEEIYSYDFWTNICLRMNKNSVVIFNSGTDNNYQNKMNGLQLAFEDRLVFKNISDKNYNNQLYLIRPVVITQ